MPMNYNYLGNDVDSPTSMVNVLASALANSAREQREMELYRLRAQQLQEQGGDARLRAASALMRDIAAANLSGAKTTTENMRQGSANEIGRIMYERAAPRTNETRFNLFGGDESPIGAFKSQLDAADLRRHIAKMQALKDPTGVGEAVSGAQFGLNLDPSNQEQAFAGMTSKPSFNQPAGSNTRDMLRGMDLENPREIGAPNRIPLNERVMSILSTAYAKGDLDQSELEPAYARLMNLAQGGGAGDLPKITTQEQFDALPSGARYINRSGNVARKP